jgi:type II secretory pathway predicted ATPase ExeA
LLGNFEQPENPFLQILLVGQPELDEVLNREDMRPLKQRIGARFRLGPLAPAEVGEYMRHRWLSAGGTELPFTTEAIEDVAYASHQIPRLINALSDNALIAAFADRSSRVLHRHVREAAATLDLDKLPPREEPPAKPDTPMRIRVQERKSPLWKRWVTRHENA